MVLSSSIAWQFLRGSTRGAKKQQHGIDLTLMKVFTVAGGEIFCDGGTVANTIRKGERVLAEKRMDGKFVINLQPGNMYSFYFDQGIELPSNVKANIIHRSSPLRSGTFIFSAEYDPGFKCSNMGAFAYVTAPLTVEVGARVAQLVCYQVEGEVQAYNGQWQGEKA